MKLRVEMVRDDRFAAISRSRGEVWISESDRTSPLSSAM
jgi:hypothetical protein